MIGISKRELLCDYYPDEIPMIFEMWGELHGIETEKPPEEVDPLEFLRM